MEFGEKLKLLLQERKLTQAQFGKEIGVHNVSISQFITGAKTPPIEVVRKVIDYFEDVDLNWLLRKDSPSRVLNEPESEYQIPVTPATLIENIEKNLKELKAQMSQK